MKRISLLFVLICLVFPVFSLKNFNLSKNQELEQFKMMEHESSCESESSVTSLESELMISSSSQSFNFSSNKNITAVLSEGNVSLQSYSINGNNIECILNNFVNLGEISLKFYSQDQHVSTNNLYFAIDESGNYYSSAISLDTCRRAAGHVLDYELVYENDEINNLYEGVASPTSIGVTGSISGVLQWKDSSGTLSPLIGAKIKATISGSWWSNITFTNSQGYYNIIYNDIWYIGTGKPSVHIYTEGENVKVHNGGTYVKSYEFNGSSGDWVFNYLFSPFVDDMGKAMMIFQGVKNYDDFAKNINGGSFISFCNVKYPDRSDEYAAYVKSNNTIYLGSKARKNSSYPDMYAAWDVLGHEYAHHVQNHYSLSNNPALLHTITLNAIDEQVSKGRTLQQAKEEGMRLAFAEGWASYWSIVAQKSFPNNLKTIQTVGDNLYTSATFGVDLDVYSNSSFGDASELVIQRILYKLYSVQTDTYDKFALGESILWNIVLNNKPYTFHSFISSLYANHYDKFKIAILLGKYNVITNSMTIEDNYLNTYATFSWSTYMGSANLRFNQFDLYFERNDGTLIEKISNISATGASCTYTVNSTIWQKIKNLNGNSYKVYFVARQTNYFVSGNYYSIKFTFDKPYTNI